MAGIIVSGEAMKYVKEKGMKRPNIVIYRDASGIVLGYTTKKIEFAPAVKVMGREPNELFVVVESRGRIPIWAERGLLPWLASSGPVAITLKKGLRKGLKIQTGAENIERP
jgi:hypothetical protein